MTVGDAEVKLDEESQQIIARLMATGQYPSESALVEEALTRLKAKQEARREQWVSVDSLRADFDEWWRLVHDGRKQLLITEAGVPVAVLKPVSTNAEIDARLEIIERGLSRLIELQRSSASTVQARRKSAARAAKRPAKKSGGRRTS